MIYKIGLLYGDGIGPEITKSTETVLKAAMMKHGIEAEFPVYPMGWEGIEKYNEPVPQITFDGLETCHAWVFAPHDSAAYPEEHFKKSNPSGQMRHHFDLFSNVRPARTMPGIKSHVGEADVVVFRENTEGMLPDRNMYKGLGEFMPSKDMALLVAVFTRKATERIAHEAFKLAMKRKKKVTIVHKANVIQMGYGLFKDVCYEVALQYPEVAVDDYHIDAMTAHMVRRLGDFDVIVTTNLFGDILSDLAGELVGSLGLSPSINTNGSQCMAQAAHGSAPDIAGKNIANPTGLILSAAMMLRWLDTRYQDSRLSLAADEIEVSVDKLMEMKVVTKDLGGSASTTEYTEELVNAIESLS